MNLFSKARTAVKILCEKDGFYRILSILRSQYRLPIPESAYSKWKLGIESELDFWDRYIRTKGLDEPESYQTRLDPSTPLQPRPAALIPPCLTEVHILDVGAGPLTYLGKDCAGKQLRITAVDPLADEYDRILNKYGVHPPVRTERLAAESLTTRFRPNTFDLVFARNSIDHTYNPEKAILQMIKVVKRGCYVLLEHAVNEARNQNYKGLHQWNFSMSADGAFLISSRSKELNFTKKYANICTITCEVVADGMGSELLITRIQKR